MFGSGSTSQPEGWASYSSTSCPPSAYYNPAVRSDEEAQCTPPNSFEKSGQTRWFTLPASFNLEHSALSETPSGSPLTNPLKISYMIQTDRNPL